MRVLTQAIEALESIQELQFVFFLNQPPFVEITFKLNPWLQIRCLLVSF